MVKFALLDNPKTPASLISRLYSAFLATTADWDWEDTTDWYYEALYAFGHNPNTPLDVLKDICENRSSVDGVAGVASNPNAPEDLLLWIYNNSNDEWVDAELSRNPSTPPNILWHLAESDWGSDVRAGVAGNPSTPKHVLQLLTEDSNTHVRNTAIQRLNGKN